MIVETSMDTEVLQYCWLLTECKSSAILLNTSKNFTKYKNYGIPPNAKKFSETEVVRSCWFFSKNFAEDKSSAILLNDCKIFHGHRSSAVQLIARWVQ